MALQPMPADWSRALCVVAHPDDLEYGVAGAIAAWTAAGKQVVYVLVSRGEAGIDGIDPQDCGPLREAEQRAAAAVVGVEVVEFLGHADGVIEHGIPLRRDIAAAVRRHRPELVVTLNHRDRWGPSGPWNSPDHRHVGLATLDAVGDAGNRWIHRELGLDPWAGVRWVAIAGSAQPTHAVDITGTLDAAIASLEAHAAYLQGLGGGAMTDARAFLTAQAESAAEQFGGRLATSFELIPFG